MGSALWYMIKSFADKQTQELYSKGMSNKFPADVTSRASRKPEYVNLAEQLEDLKVPPGNRLHHFLETGRGSTQFNKCSVVYLFSL